MPIRDSRISTARGRRYRVYLERTAPGRPAVTRAVRSLRASAWTQARRSPYSPVSVSAARKGWVWWGDWHRARPCRAWPAAAARSRRPGRAVSKRQDARRLVAGAGREPGRLIPGGCRRGVRWRRGHVKSRGRRPGEIRL